MDLLLAGFLHPWHGADHLVAMIAVGIWAVQSGGPRGWLLPAAFSAAMPIGAVLGFASASGLLASAVEAGVAFSTIVLAASCLARPDRWRVVSVVGLAGLMHGFVHGTEAGTGTLWSALPFFLGVVVATLLLHLSGVAVGQMLRARWLTLRVVPSLMGGAMLIPQMGAAQTAAESEPARFAGAVFEGSLSGVLQRLNAGGAASGNRESRATYRGDLSASLPVAGIGPGEGLLFGQVRFGQGEGITTRPTYTGSVNSLAFQTSAGSDDSFAILAQVYYQLTMPLGQGSEAGRRRVEINVGKIDPFVFFDQNEVADNESRRFLNNVFVHNPLLDSGGDLGADKYGFTPGVRAGFFSDESERFGWGASVGAFAAGAGANFSGSPGKPFVIAQLEGSPKRSDGEASANYRIYGWTNGQSDDFDTTRRRHSGWGISLDQRLGDDWNVFGRFGQRTSGHGAFDRAITVGFELGGNHWGRADDAVGLAIGSLSTSNAYRSASADGTFIGYPASGQEKVAEIFYRYAFDKRIEISPDFQLVKRAAGDPAAPMLRTIGVRVTVSF